jgi:hypothetical protein
MIPWFTVRKVKVDVEIVRSSSSCLMKIILTYAPQPSSKVAVLRFERGMQQGLLARISRGAVTEYHAFGIIS